MYEKYMHSVHCTVCKTTRFNREKHIFFKNKIEKIIDYQMIRATPLCPLHTIESIAIIHNVCTTHLNSVY